MSGGKSRRIRVAHVVTNLWDGGIERVVLQIAAGLPADRFETRVYALLDDNPWRPVFEGRGIEVRSFSAKNRLSPRAAAPNLIAVSTLAAAMRRDGIDVVNTHDFFPGVLGRVAATMAGVPRIITTLHNTYTWLGRPHGLVNRLLAARTESVVGVSKAAIADSMRRDRLPEGSYRLIYNGVDPAEFQPDPETRARLRGQFGWGDPGTVVIGNIGTISVRKDQQTLVRAAAPLMRRNSSIRLAIVGSAREHEMSVHEGLLAAIEEEGIADRTTLLQNRKDVPQLLNAFDLFCMPSLVEGFGIALVEAMMTGLPVVCSSIPAFQEIVASGRTGLVASVGDVSAFGAALGKLVEAPALRAELGLQARGEAQRLFSLSSMLTAYAELYARSMQA